jgi:MoxR-like ATPase
MPKKRRRLPCLGPNGAAALTAATIIVASLAVPSYHVGPTDVDAFVIIAAPSLLHSGAVPLTQSRSSHTTFSRNDSYCRSRIRFGGTRICGDVLRDTASLILPRLQSVRDDETAAANASPLSLTSLDPLLLGTLLRLHQEGDSSGVAPASGANRNGSGTLRTAAHGLDVWRRCLGRGRLPDAGLDFAVVADDAEGGGVLVGREASPSVWPPEPLFGRIYDSMVQLQLPRFALRHPETVPLILRSLLRWTVRYSQRLDAASNDDEDIDDDDEDDDDDDDDDAYTLDYYFQNQLSDDNDVDDNDSLPPLTLPVDDAETIGADIAREVLREWGGVVYGVNLLDKMFGYDHGLLQVNVDDGGGSQDGGTGGGPLGFGIQDGVWSHSGWRAIPGLQQQVSNMPELKALVRELGRRPSADSTQKSRLEKFDPRQRRAEGAMGAEFDDQQRESVSGITTSGSLAEMLPSEAVLLRGSSPALRVLFLAKKVESKLLSYQLSGWTDIPSVPRPRPRYRNRLPSAPGGPMIVCLDTSWSMSTGTRESLSKAVVLACVTAAHRQGRDCHVIAFSNERGVVDTQILSADVKGIQRLLDFLSFSFGGGTDVTGALKLAIQKLQGESAAGGSSGRQHPDGGGDDGRSMDAADILLVTDGEIPDPPVSAEVMESLNRIRQNKGVQVHGLLVGRTESKPLERLCTQTHDFLTKYDFAPSSSLSSSSSTFPTKLSSSSRMGPAVKGATSQRRSIGRTSSALFAQSSSSYGEENETAPGRRREWQGRRDTRSEAMVNEINSIEEVDVSGKRGLPVMDTSATSLTYPESLDAALNTVRDAAMQRVSEKTWKDEALEKERPESYWKSHQQLKVAVERVQDGLVERAEDARLVVLAMISNEHILLLGKPGTGKSILGLRLAELCEGRFFQRLLTRFTTPDELFGPLSLKSLENDEYRRCTAGFLPTADIAFLDEIFKANSAILNTLLTILNERKFDNAGGRETCPIRCVVGASNELPESDELMALFDRFLIRKEVTPVSDDGVLSLLSMSNPGMMSSRAQAGTSNAGFANDLQETIESLSRAADSVTIDMDGRTFVRDLRSYLRDEKNIEISDRRLVKAARLLKLSAASDGRTKVDPIDFLLLQHCFWNQPEERVVIREWLWENLTPMDGNDGTVLQQIRFLLDNVREEAMVAVRKTAGDITGSRGAQAQDLAVIDSLKAESGRIAAIVQERLNNLARHEGLLRTCQDSVWIDAEDATAMKQLLLPRAETLVKEVVNLSRDAHALEITLSPTFASEIADDVRLNVIQGLWESGFKVEKDFSEAELSISMKEAKAKYDLETFRRWKRTKKKTD